MKRCLLFSMLLVSLTQASEKPARTFVAPRRPAVPDIRHRQSVIANPIDSFIVSRLLKAGVAPSSEADRMTLLRRVTYDLTGLPPTSEEVEAVRKDKQEGWY